MVACRTLATVFIACSLVAGSFSTSAELVDAVAATVDKEVILYSELIAEIGTEIESLRASATDAADFERRSTEIIRGALDLAIESKILYREAQKFDVQITDDEIEERMQSIRELYDTPEEFIRELQAAGESVSDFRERAKKQMMSQRISYSKLRTLEEEIVVSDQEIAEFYSENESEFIQPEEIRVRQIFLLVGRDEEVRREARERLSRIRDEILAGADFAELARAHSQAPGAEEGGIIGWQKRGDLVQPLEDAAFALAADGVSELVETRGGLHILKIDERKDRHVVPLDDVRFQIEPVLRNQAAQARYDTWLNELRKRSRVRIFL